MDSYYYRGSAIWTNLRNFSCRLLADASKILLFFHQFTMFWFVYHAQILVGIMIRIPKFFGFIRSLFVWCDAVLDTYSSTRLHSWVAIFIVVLFGRWFSSKTARNVSEVPVDLDSSFFTSRVSPTPPLVLMLCVHSPATLSLTNKALIYARLTVNPNPLPWKADERTNLTSSIFSSEKI